MSNSDVSHQLQIARAALDDGQIEAGIRLLDGLVLEGNAEAMFLRSQVGVEDETEEVFWARSVALLQEAAKTNHGPAAYTLSILLEEGEVVPRNKEQAMQLMIQAAQSGHPHALWRLGLLHLHRIPANADDQARGRKLIEEAAAKKSQGALRTLAAFHGDGSHGYAKNLALAKELMEKAESADVLLL